jgi:hypothetical protein
MLKPIRLQKSGKEHLFRPQHDDMLGSRHLHIGQEDPLSDWASKILHHAKTGTLEISYDRQPSVKINIEGDRINVDLLRPELFKVSDDETGLFDKLKTASEFGRKLSDNDVTMSFLRKGKEVVRLGRDARPTLSKVVTRSNDLQLASLREFAKLKRDLKTD